MSVSDLVDMIKSLDEQMEAMKPLTSPNDTEKEKHEKYMKYGDLKNQLLKLLWEFFEYHTKSQEGWNRQQQKLLEGLRLMCRSPEVTNVILFTWIKKIAPEFNGFTDIPQKESTK